MALAGRAAGGRSILLWNAVPIEITEKYITESAKVNPFCRIFCKRPRTERASVNIRIRDMPLFCELDEVMIALQHGVLHRARTLASGGAYCDYFITGDKETL